MRLFAQWWTQNREHSTELTIHKNTWCLNVGKDADERDVHYFCWRLIAVLLLHWHPFRFVCLLSLHKLCVHKLPVDSLPTSSSRDRDWFTSTLLRNKCETHMQNSAWPACAVVCRSSLRSSLILFNDTVEHITWSESLIIVLVNWQVYMLLTFFRSIDFAVLLSF